MQDVTTEPPGRKWFHVVWHTHRRRRVFKIPAAARFCERELSRALRRRGWIVDGLVCTADRVQALVRRTTPNHRGEVVRELQDTAARTLRRVWNGSHPPGRLWDERGVWCAVITNAGAAAAIRRHLQGRAHALGADDRIELGRRGGRAQ